LLVQSGFQNKRKSVDTERFLTGVFDIPDFLNDVFLGLFLFLPLKFCEYSSTKSGSLNCGGGFECFKLDVEQTFCADWKKDGLVVFQGYFYKTYLT